MILFLGSVCVWSQSLLSPSWQESLHRILRYFFLWVEWIRRSNIYHLQISALKSKCYCFWQEPFCRRNFWCVLKWKENGKCPIHKAARAALQKSMGNVINYLKGLSCIMTIYTNSSKNPSLRWYSRTISQFEWCNIIRYHNTNRTAY